MDYLTRCYILVIYMHQLGDVCEVKVDDLQQTGSLAESFFLVLILF